MTPVVAFGYKQCVRLTPEWPSPEEGILPTACTSLRLPDASMLPQSSRRSGLLASVLVFALDCPDSLSAQEAESALKHEGVVISTGPRSFGGNQDRIQTRSSLQPPHSPVPPRFPAQPLGCLWLPVPRMMPQASSRALSPAWAPLLLPSTCSAQHEGRSPRNDVP